MDRFLKDFSNANFFIATDDGAPCPPSAPWPENVTRRVPLQNIKNELKRIYDGRVLSYNPRSLDRNRMETQQDALIDFLILRQTDYIAGTAGSGFSEMALLGKKGKLIEVT